MMAFKVPDSTYAAAFKPGTARSLRRDFQDAVKGGDPRSIEDAMEKFMDYGNGIYWQGFCERTGTDETAVEIVFANTSRHEYLPGCSRQLMTPTLINVLLTCDVSKIRARATLALGDSRDKSAIPALITALKDSDSLVRTWAAEALGKNGDKRAVPALITALKDNVENDRSAAAYALGNIGDKRAVPALIAALNSPDCVLKAAAAEALGKIGDKSAIPALKAADKGDARLDVEKALHRLTH